MKPRKSTVLVALLALLLLATFAIAVGQGTTGTQTDQKKKVESCCAEGANCCAEGSCKDEARSCCKEGAECCKEGAECCKKHEGCCGESCELDANHGSTGKNDAKGKHDGKKHGECCKVKNKEGKTKTK